MMPTQKDLSKALEKFNNTNNENSDKFHSALSEFMESPKDLEVDLTPRRMRSRRKPNSIRDVVLDRHLEVTNNSYFIMRKHGTFRINETSRYQCGEEGILEFKYQVTLLIDGDHPLNQYDQLLFHEKISEAVEDSFIEGSCERMHLQMFEFVANMLIESGIEALIYKGFITPTKLISGSPSQASLEYIKIKEGYEDLIGLIS